MQYKRLANLYFLIVAIISTIPKVTPLNPGLIWAPMVFVLIISLAKQCTYNANQAYEDYNRYKTDRQVNDEYETSVFRGDKVERIKWKDVVVGDICKVFDKETFPADLILISSSDKDGVAKIQTASLDGEQTLKSKYAFTSLNSKYRNDNMESLEGSFEGQIPSFSLSQFRGTLEISDEKIIMSDNSQLLYRGAKLKATQWIWGIVVYTGQCSKIMMNGQNFSTKLSNVQKKLNYLLLIMLAIQLGLCLFVASLSVQKHQAMSSTQDYILWPQGQSNVQIFIMNLLLFFVQFSSSIPVSLIVTIQIAKTVQSYFIDFDQLMFSSWRKKKVYARIASLNQELGQVQYLFTDKTGTLTKNLLKFHTAIIGNKTYQFEYHPQKNIYRNQNMLKLLDGLKKNDSNQEQSNHSNKQSFALNNHFQVTKLYLMCLLLCNDVSTVGNQQQGISYQSQSPDQIALVNLARDNNFKLVKRDKDSLKVNINNVYYKVEVVARFLFTSERKRMSIIVKWKGQYLLFTKGADNIILQRSERSRFPIELSIDELAKSGLRSLIVAFRVITAQEVAQFIRDMESASMIQRQAIKEEYAQKFEGSLNILGTTGLLDELQDGVPQTLRDLQRAGIRVWMLTGDKLQTSFQVGKSCNLIEPDSQVIFMRNSLTPVKQLIEESKLRISNSIRKYSLIIEGSVLAKIINSPAQEQFTHFTLFFSSVICCRMLPVQKSQVVGIVKRHLSKICLAVGDGGNDVSMIKQANIGVGLYGQEGMSAVQASDYAIPQFRMIWRLLFVHGRWNYIRISQMILYFIYKSVIFTVPRLLFAFYNAFSGYPLYDDYYIALYNVVFTALPLLIRALFEQDFNYVVKITEKSIENQDQSIKSQLEQSKFLPKGYKINQGFRMLFPKIYFVGQKNICFNVRECILWLTQAIIMGACLLFIIILTLGSPILNQKGHNSNLYLISITVYTGVVIIVTVKLCMQVKHWTKLLFFSITLLSIAPYLSFMWVVNYYFKRPLQRVLALSYSTGKAYLSVLFFILASIGLHRLIVYIRFQSHQILKKMSFALSEDEQMIEYLSNKNDSNSSEQSGLIIRKKLVS